MNDLFNMWWVRAAITGGLTWASFKYLPAGNPVRLVAVAGFGMATVGIVAGNAPLVGPLLTSVMQGRLPLLPAAAQTTSAG